jgi:hypothetical protein
MGLDVDSDLSMFPDSRSLPLDIGIAFRPGSLTLVRVAELGSRGQGEENGDGVYVARNPEIPKGTGSQA